MRLNKTNDVRTTVICKGDIVLKYANKRKLYAIEILHKSRLKTEGNSNKK